MDTRDELLPCPFCEARPHQGPTKARPCSLHGEPLQDYRIWCPHGCADIQRPNKERAATAWNTRAVNAHPALVEALEDLKQAVDFFDKVKAATPDERAAVGGDHWGWLEKAARRAALALSARGDGS